MPNTVYTFLALAALGLLLSGCISHKTTVYRDASRTPVTFENDTAARLFYETLQKTRSDRPRTESTTEIEIPFVFDHERKVVENPSQDFNQAVLECDTNRDGKITEQEARIFAARK